MELPAGWASVSLDEVAEVSGGIQKQQKRRPVENVFPFLRVANVGRGSLDLSVIHQVELFDGEIDRFRLRSGDLLVVEGNGSPDQIGRAATWRDEVKDAVHQNHLIRVRPGEMLFSKYLELVWNSRLVADQLMRVAQSTSGLYTLSTSKLKRVELPLPPLAEQHRIVEALEGHLSRLDVAVALVSRARKRAAHLHACVTDITWGYTAPEGGEAAPLPSPAGSDDGALPTLPVEWEWLRLGDLAEVVGGVTKDQKKQSDPEIPEVPYLRVANVQRGKFDLTRVMHIRVPAKKAEQLRLLPGDVLLNEGGDRNKLGRGWVWDGQIEGAIHQNHVFRARIRDGRMHAKLLSWHANRSGSWFEVNGKQSVNLASISLSKIKSFPVPVPSREAQASILDRIEGQVSLLEKADALTAQALSSAEALRRAILNRAFTGALVPQDPADEPATVLLARIQADRDAQSKAKRPRRAPAAPRKAKTPTAPETAPAPAPTPTHAVQQEFDL
ncbi:restriction endonuclease subunit S [Streptomyces sp. NPDC050255]|uniref:restriction endonuclease subunit S n=1 Tax=Streptomyces sp. NPDC050255 TaxID=3365606 RepID=UPI00379D6A69